MASLLRGRRYPARRRRVLGSLEACEDRTLMATAFGITGAGSLLRFDTATPGTIASSIPITGIGGGETLQGIDFRPANGQLYALTRDAANVGRLYTINTTTAAATLAATLAADPVDATDPYTTLTGNSFGIDFNPVPDRLRVVSDTGRSLRINVDNGLVTTDGGLNPGLPNVAGVAYTNSFPGTGTTSLYDIDFTLNTLQIQNPPNNGTLTNVGPLGVDVSSVIGFDIVSTGDKVAPVNSALAAFNVGGTTGLYSINLVTGAATLAGTIGNGATGVIGLAVRPTSSDLANGANALGVDGANNLVRFNTMTPGTIESSTPITGLQGGEAVLGLDFRPANGVLYALGSTSRLYTIDPTTGAATAVGAPFSPALSGTSFGFDFNPVADRIRVVSNTGQDLRLNPDTGAVAAVDGPLNPGTPNVVGVAYTNSFIGATTTTLYDIDSGTDTLLIQNPPNSGTLVPVGPLGVDVTDVLGFDIRPGLNTALASLVVGGTPGLYAINLTTGAASLVGAFGGGTTVGGLALIPNGVLRFNAPTYTINENGIGFVTIAVERVGGTDGTVSATFRTSDGTATAPGDYQAQTVLLTYSSGTVGPLTIDIPIVNDGQAEGGQTFTIALSDPTNGVVLGSSSTAVVTIVDSNVFQATAFGVDTSNNLVRFRVADPGTTLSTTPITGLQAGESVLAIDFRPINGVLYALGSSSRIYAINQATGAATAIGSAPFAPALNGTEFGFDFNPVVDRIRLTSSAGQDLRLSADTGAVVATDGPLAYGAGDVNFGQTPSIVGSAYTNNAPFAATTTLYDIDSNLDILAIQNPPNSGTLTTVGPLGVDVQAVLGFDIVTLDGANTGLATLVVGGVPRLYLIDLATGAASALGALGGGSTLRALAIAPQGFTATIVGSTVTFAGTAASDTITFDAAGGLLRHNRFSLGDAGFNSDFDFDSTTAGDQTLSASNSGLSLIVNAGNGDDQFNLGTATSPASQLAASFTFNGQGGNDHATIEDTADTTGRTVGITSGAVSGIGGPVNLGTLESLVINAGGGNDRFNIQGTTAATNVNTGGGDDTVAFGNGATLSGGFLDGGAGSNTLDYSAYTTAVTVNLASSATSTLFVARLSGVQEPGPLSPSQGSGYGTFLLNAAQTQLAFNIPYRDLEGASLSGAHFHNEAFGINGPIVRGIGGSELNGSILPSGILSGIWSSSDSQGLTPALVAQLLAGRIYTNLHTLPSQPSGEIRGQLFSLGNVNPATGTAGVRGFDNINGGLAGDGLTGNANVNIIRGGGGDDTVVGGQGGDQLFGDDANDLLVWNNGDGSDLMEGGAGSDIVQVNGSAAGGDQFLIQVNPNDSTRLRFDRTNLGLFNLDIGTTEGLEFNTLGGDDTTTVDFAGGNPIPVNGIHYDGGAGSDRLVLQRSAGTFTATNETYNALAGDSGTISFDGSTVSFAGLEPIDDTVPAANFTFNAPPGDQAIHVIDGPLVGGFATTQIGSGDTPSAFERINVANKTHVNITTASGEDSVVLNHSTPAAGLATLTINTNGGPDQVTIVATPPATATIINTGSGDDLVSLTAASLGVGGSITLNGGTGFDGLRFDAQGGFVTATPTSLTFNGQVVNLESFESIEVVNAQGTPLVPVLPPLPIHAIEGGQIVDVIVARFTDADLGAKAADFVASIAWGDGSTSAGVIVQDASDPSQFYVTGTHLYRDQGTFNVITTIVDTGGTTTATTGNVTITTTTTAEPPISTSSPATVADAPIVASGATVAGRAGPTLDGLVATFTTTDPNATAADFLAFINWGDGQPATPGTISIVGTPPGSLTFRVSGTHAYAERGTYVVTTTIQSVGGSAAIAHGSAIIAEALVPLTVFGQLQAASDTGVSNTDGVTNDSTPTFIGTATPGAVIRVFDGAQPATRQLIASAVADAAGTWHATASQPLVDGTYANLSIEATGQSGLTGASAPLPLLVVDTVGPRVTDLNFDRLKGRLKVAIQDERGGLDPFSLIDGANYHLSGMNLVSPRRNAPKLVTTAETTPATDPTAPQVVTLTINNGRPLRGGSLRVIIRSGGIQDRAGNGLDGEFYGFFPSGNTRPGGDFVARIDSIRRVVSAPLPIRNGFATPLTPPGRQGLRLPLGQRPSRLQAGRPLQKLGQAHPNGPSPTPKTMNRPALATLGHRQGRV